MLRRPIIRHRFPIPLIFPKTHSFLSTSSAAAVTQYDAVSRLLAYLNPPTPHYSTRFFFNSLKHDCWFKDEVFRLSPSEIDTIIGKLRPDFAIGLFFLLQNVFGIKHLIDTKLVIAHDLAEKKHSRALQCHLQRVLQEEGSGSAPSICALLSRSFIGWDSNHMVWDMLAFVYSQSGMVHDALFVLSMMKDLSIQPSIMTYNSLLHNLRGTDIMWDMYSELVSNGPRPTDYTNSIFLDGLCKQSLIHEAIPFMREIEEKNGVPCVVWFNTLMSGFCKQGFVDIAKSFFCMMFKHGLSPDVYSYNIIVHGLCVSGSLEEALGFINDMEKHGLEPDKVTYTILSKGFRLFSMGGSMKVTQRTNSDLLTYTILICGHCQMGNIEEAFRLLEEMLSKGLKLDGISYRALISSLCKSGKINEALSLLYEVEKVGLKPDLFMYSIIINGFCKLGEVKKATFLYKEMCKKRIVPNSFPHRSILFGLCEERTIIEARSYFDMLWNSGFMEDVVLYNIMIDKYIKDGNFSEAVDIYDKLIEKGVSPTIVTFNSLINGLCKNGKIIDARKWLIDIKMHNLVPSLVTYTTLMNAFCEVGNLRAMFELQNEMVANGVEPNQVTYTVIMKGLCKHGMLLEAFRVMEDMLAKGLFPDQTAFNSLIQSFCEARDLNRAFQLHDKMVSLNIRPNVITHNILINGLCVYGKLIQASRFFYFVRDVKHIELSKTAYTTFIKTLCAKGNPRKAVVLFQRMAEIGFEVTVRDYIAVINRLCKRSLLCDAMMFFRMMLMNGVSPDPLICSVMIHSFHKVNYHREKIQFHGLMIKRGFDNLR